MTAERIADFEVVVRHIPGGTTFQAPGPRITSGNFVLREGETGVSVSRAAITTSDALLDRIGNRDNGSLTASATVEAIRGIGFDVVPAPLPEDPGHAEIREVSASFSSRADRRRLTELFGFSENV